MDIIAFYLPQYYTFPENDKWWGDGFTEWTNVKKSKPLYKGHVQPTTPLNNNYYCLEDKNVFAWQIELAQKYGVTGFCFYHYWMGEGRQLMEKPVDLYLENTDLEFPFCISWANHNWARTWTGGDTDILMDVRYGDETEWEKHFAYLLKFFNDKRYIKYDNKPLLIIYQPELIPNLHAMLEYFIKRACECGLEGITFVSQAPAYIFENNNEPLISYSISYEPNYTRRACSIRNLRKNFQNIIRADFTYIAYEGYVMFRKAIKKVIGGEASILSTDIINYDAIWKTILRRKCFKNNIIPGVFVNIDTSPRKGYRGMLTKGFSPEKFGYYFEKMLFKTYNEYKKNVIFVMAWNEWGEGAYLEPDEKYKYSVLEHLKKAKENFENKICEN